KPCSAKATTGSSAPTAGAPTTTSTRAAVGSAGRTCSATSPPTAKRSANNKSSETPASSSRTTSSTPGSSFSTTLSEPRSNADRAAPDQAPHPARARLAQEHQDQVPPTVRTQPAQTPACPLHLHPHQRSRADQQPRRTRPPRRRHLPQALTR